MNLKHNYVEILVNCMHVKEGLMMPCFNLLKMSIIHHLKMDQNMLILPVCINKNH